MVDLQKITLDLNRRFAAPLPEFYNRRIIFWKDEDREFEDKIGELELEQAKVLTLSGRNTFAAKKLLAVDDPHSNSERGHTWKRWKCAVHQWIHRHSGE